MTTSKNCLAHPIPFGSTEIKGASQVCDSLDSDALQNNLPRDCGFVAPHLAAYDATPTKPRITLLISRLSFSHLRPAHLASHLLPFLRPHNTGQNIRCFKVTILVFH
jgi:hypothetical protein